MIGEAMIVYCATSNPGKLREFQLAAPDFDVRPLPTKAPPPEETGATFEENAAAKAEYYGRFVDGYLFADDSGLEVDALGGAPGVHSARYAGPHATDVENNALLLDRLEGVADRSARFVCVIALVKNVAHAPMRAASALMPTPSSGDELPIDADVEKVSTRHAWARAPQGSTLVKTFRGTVEGRILDGPRGDGGFGYDPLFYYEPFGCTFGEASIDRKMRVSHRAQALEAMFTFLRNTASI